MSRSSALSRFLPLLFVLPLMAACGHTAAHMPSTPTGVVAAANGHTIPNSTINRYVRYAAQFFASAYPGSIGATRGCMATSQSTACRSLRDQVIARLLQQSAIVDYAHRHHITLSSADRAAVSTEMVTLTDPTSETADLYRGGASQRAFVRQILLTQALVLKVELQVVGVQASQGDAYHIDKYVMPTGPHAQRQALNLATDGKPVPADATLHTEWEASFRLHGALKSALSVARPGDFVGPFKQSGGYLVVHLLDHGTHVYGRPARQARMTDLFRGWLRAQLRKDHLACSSATYRRACALALTNPT
jgi:hypothetical protein